MDIIKNFSDNVVFVSIGGSVHRCLDCLSALLKCAAHRGSVAPSQRVHDDIFQIKFYN